MKGNTKWKKAVAFAIAAMLIGTSLPSQKVMASEEHTTQEYETEEVVTEEVEEVVTEELDEVTEEQLQEGTTEKTIVVEEVIPEEPVKAPLNTPVGKHGKLSVSGTKIVDQNGTPFQLRGISTHGINWDVGYPYVNGAAFQTLRDDWGANTIRLAMYTAEYNGYCAGGDQNALKALVNRGVSYATNLGMYVIIDWHILNDNNPLQNKESAKAFFREMSARYHNYDNVIYEICNEPNNCSWEDIKTYANEVIPIIRANDKDAIIIVGTPTWSQLGYQGHTNEVADSPLTGYSNLVYTLHFYCAEPSHSQYLPAKVDYAVSKGLPILVSEFGLSEASGNGRVDTAMGTTWLQKLDGYGIGYVCWSLSNKPESASLLAPGCGKTSSWTEAELSEAGRFIRNQYRARKESYAVVDRKKVEDFVRRMYTKGLKRKAEPAGLAYWTEELVQQRKSGAAVAYYFFFMDEFKKKHYSNEEYVEILYQVMMDRKCDKAGKQYWVKLLQQGISRECVFANFVYSEEYTKICSDYGIQRGTVNLKPKDRNAGVTLFVSRIYKEILGRNADEAGLNHWCNVILTKTKTPEEVAMSFLFSPEFTKKNLSNQEYVKVLYRTFFGRTYDKGGLDYWCKQLKSGMSRRVIVSHFAHSQEFKAIMKQYGL